MNEWIYIYIYMHIFIHIYIYVYIEMYTLIMCEQCPPYASCNRILGALTLHGAKMEQRYDPSSSFCWCDAGHAPHGSPGWHPWKDQGFAGEILQSVSSWFHDKQLGLTHATVFLGMSQCFSGFSPSDPAIGDFVSHSAGGTDPCVCCWLQRHSDSAWVWKGKDNYIRDINIYWHILTYII